MALKKIATIVGIAVVLFAGGTRARVASRAAVDDSFLEDCVWDKCKFRDNRVMGTYCNNDNTKTFDYDWTQIDMGRCLGNHNGKLVIREDGQFYKTCDGCKLANKHDDGTQFFSCKCKGASGDRRESKVDLAKVMYNEDGALGCFSHLGSKHDRPPTYWSADGEN